MQSLRRLFIILSAGLLLALTSACLMPREPPPPPFRVAPYGAGLEMSLSGKLVTLTDEHGEHQGRLRVASHSLRAQQADAVPIGRIRFGKENWIFSNRAGTDVCHTPRDNELPNFRIDCVDELKWQVTADGQGVEMRGPNERLDHIPLRSDTDDIRSGGQPWSPQSVALMHRAFDAEFDGQIDFAAYVLAAWTLRHWEAPEEDISAADADSEQALDEHPTDVDTPTAEEHALDDTDKRADVEEDVDTVAVDADASDSAPGENTPDE